MKYRVLFVLFCIVLTSPVMAETFSWQAYSGGDFDDWHNWLPPGVPGSGDIAQFDMDGNYQVDFSGDTTISQVDIIHDIVQFNLPAGANLTVENSLGIGQTGGPGRLKLAGAGNLDITNALTVGGGSHQSFLEINGTVSVSSNTGTIAQGGTSISRVWVDGGSWIISDELSIESDASAEDSVYLKLLSGSVAADVINIDGDNSVFQFVDGYLTAGEIVESSCGFLWGSNTGTLVITGPQGYTLDFLPLPCPQVLTLTTEESMTVDGTLTIDSGFQFSISGGGYSFGDLYLNGGVIYSSGSFDLDDTNGCSGHGLIVGDVYAGNSSISIMADGSMELGNSSSSNGFNYAGILNVGPNIVELHDSNYAKLGVSTVVGDSGQITADNGIELGAGDTMDFSSGTCYIVGNVKNNGAINGPASNGILVMGSSIIGTGTYTGHIYLPGDYDPSASPNLITFGTLLQLTNTSQVTMELLGTTPYFGHDQLVINGHFIQGGTLTVVNIGTYQPSAGDSYHLFDFISSAGAFDTLDLPELNPGLTWDVSDLSTTGTIHVVSDATPTPVPTPTLTPVCIHHGDTNLDGTITAGDAQLAFSIVLGQYSPSYEENCAADCNGDGNVTAGDAQNIFYVVLGSDSCVDPL